MDYSSIYIARFQSNIIKYSRCVVRVLAVAVSMVLVACGGNPKDERDTRGNTANINEMATKIARTSMVADYPKVPQDEILNEMPGSRVYAELQQRYTEHLRQLQEVTAANHVKLVVLIMTPEVGKFATPANVYGIPYIRQICTNLKVPCEDITDAVSEWTTSVNHNETPLLGNWTVQSAGFAARTIAPLLAKYGGFRSGKTWQERPAVLGDVLPDNVGLDENNNDLPANTPRPPYKIKVSKQGLRMPKEVVFPADRERIVFTGDSRIFNPFIDDDQTICQRLQSQMPDKEIINAANICGAMDDYASLFTDKLQYLEPDILVVCTHGADITDEFFSHRNRYARQRKSYKPSNAEKEFYEKTFPTKKSIIPL
mgnify:CR=1 FL=1